MLIAGPAPSVPRRRATRLSGRRQRYIVVAAAQEKRRAPDGRLDRVIDVPVKKPTCCAFGGADLGTLYITSSRLAETDEALAREPTAGGLFKVLPGIRGIADPPFAG